MALSEEEAQKIKEHLLKQLSNFPEEKQEQIKEQVEALTTPQVEQFIQENKLTHLGGQCIFCSIVSGQSPSIKIGEDNENIAILEINPLSKGHTLIVPKKHSEEINSSTINLGKEISRILEKKFSPKEIKTNELKIMGHSLIEVVPIYGDETERAPAQVEELKGIQEEILRKEEVKIEPEEKIEEPETEPQEEIHRFPPRIP